MAHRAVLPPALSGGREEISGRAGRISLYVKGSGPPLLLLHSINAAASAYEIKPIWDALGQGRRVYAPDLPGFGFSDRSERGYDRQLYVDAIFDMLDAIAREHGSAPVDVLALSLVSEFLARAAVTRPERFGRLVLVNPTGFQAGAGRLVGPPGGTREVPAVHAIVSAPVISDLLWNGLVSRASIRYFLRKTFGTRDIDEGLFEYAWITAHQPGARRAPFAFVSGRLFSADIRTVYERIAHPVWLPHGTLGDFGDFSESEWLATRPNWKVQAYPTGALVHFQAQGAFMAGLEAFLEHSSGAEALDRRQV